MCLTERSLKKKKSLLVILTVQVVLWGKTSTKNSTSYIGNFEKMLQKKKKTVGHNNHEKRHEILEGRAVVIKQGETGGPLANLMKIILYIHLKR